MNSEPNFLSNFEDIPIKKEYFVDVSISHPQRRRSSHRVWMKTGEFDSAKEAEENVKSQKIWKRSSLKRTLEGEKIEFRCTKGQFRRNECPAGLYLLYHSSDSRVSMFTTVCQHGNHDKGTGRGLDGDIADLVRSLFADGIQKPNEILAAIRRQNVQEPPKAKLITFLQKLRTHKCGSLTISASEISNWCEKRKQVPNLKDTPFVLDYIVHCESFGAEQEDIKILMSTTRLLEQLTKSDMVQINETCKITWQGYPVVIVGTSDQDKAFHPFGIAVCKGETADDFGFIFATLRKYNTEWKPLVLIADESEAISNGFNNIFGPPKVQIMCFSHALKNMETHLRGINYAACLKDDIYALHASKNEDTFIKASNLFLEKWRAKNDSEIDSFLRYFESQWLQKNRNWYEGAAIGYPSTNNGIEAANAIIQKGHTLRERLPVGQFLNNVFDILISWSKDRNPESPHFKCFAMEPSISLKDWTEAYQWATANKKVLQLEAKTSSTLFYTCSSESEFQDLTVDLLQNYINEEGCWRTFDEFEKYNYGLWAINIIPSDLPKCSCTCLQYLRNLNCKHILGMKIRLRLLTVPPQVKRTSLGQNRKRGRPCKSKKAVIIQ